MLTKESLEKLISQDENKNLELKKSTGELKEGMRSACAFLNTEGDLFDDRIMQNRPRKYAWELQPAENISIEDLDENRIRGSVRVGVEGGRISEMSLHASISEILEKWELLEHGVVNNAAAVLSATKRTGDFVLRMARFRGTDKLHFVDNQRIHGNFYELMDAGMAFFFKHLSLSGEITGWFREEHLDIPVAALREALINAFCPIR